MEKEKLIVIAKTISHYKILEKLGQGGMGVVYKAEDTKLKREVAIKFLPRQIAASEKERKRFKIEAQAAAALNHPNIATIYAIEEIDDEMFIVMEYIEGQELKDIVGNGRDRSLPIEDVVDYATQIAAGLQAAHEKDVTHRDIKSANIMVTDKGQVKIMDFGLAKVAGGQHLTKSGMTVGTVAFMSPEQAQGIAVDRRTDIWALGVVFYEMLTGEQPFKGDYEQAVIYSIMNEEPEPLTGLRTGVPLELERIVDKCLEKQASDRYQHADELIVDLQRVRRDSHSGSLKHSVTVSKRQAKNRLILVGSTLLLLALLFIVGLQLFKDRGGGIESLAVLPLVNIANDAEQEYFVEGMTEILIAELSKIKALRVISRTSVMQYKDTRKPLSEIADELGVDAVVEGSVLRADDRVRITVQLIEANPERNLWAEVYDRELRDILTLSSEVTQAIVQEIRATLTPEEKHRLTSARPINPEAHEAYLKGRYHWNKRTAESLNKAIEYFLQAVEIDSNYALAYAGLADAYYLLPFAGDKPPREAVPKAKAAAMKALEFDESLAEAHVSLAGAAGAYDWDWSRSEMGFKRAIELNPGYATAHHWYGLYLMRLGRYDEAISEITRAQELDPLSVPINGFAATIYYVAGRPGEIARTNQENA